MSTKFSHIALSERKILLRFFDAIFILASLWASSIFLEFDYVDFSNDKIFSWATILLFYFLLFGQIFELYSIQISGSRFRVVRSLFLTSFFTTLFFTFTPFLSPELPPNRAQIIYLFFYISVPVLIWRFFYIFLLFSPKYFKVIVVISHSSRIKKILELISNHNFHNVASYVSDEKTDDFNGYYDVKSTDIYRLIKSSFASEVIISTRGFSSDDLAKINKDIILLFEEGINIKSYETFYEELTDRVPKEYLSHQFYKNINLSKNLENKLYIFGHKIIDLLVSIIGLLILTPIIPVVIIANLIGNRGPLFYRQERVGEKGKVFTILKLRSMVPNAEKMGAVYAEKNDNRITVFGRFLRNTRLDEAPQFFNILKGDMSLIGPRPERPEFVRDLEEKIPFYAIRHVIKPGLTGWAQVKYPYAGTIEEQEKKLRYDLFYIKERSLFLDFKIIIKTITTVLFFKGQ